MELFNFSVNLILLIVCLTMGALFLAYPVPKDIKLQNYRKSLRILAVAYFIMALLNSVFIFLHLEIQTPGFFDFVVLLTSSLQALLFAFTLIVLLNPTFFKSRRIFFDIAPIVLFCLVYILSLAFIGDCEITRIEDFFHCSQKPTVIIRLLFFLYYCFVLIYYSRLLLKQEKEYLREINNHFSDISKLKMKWVKWAFFLAIAIGVMAIGIPILPGMIYDSFFSIILIIFYFGFALRYINYNRIFEHLGPVLDSMESSHEKHNITPKPRIIWSELKKIITSEKYFLITGITLEQMSELLQVGRTSLSNLINSKEGVSFNSWVNSLRIEEAKSLLLENPNYNINMIAELTGYSELSNFSRQFKSLVGESPSEWRRKKMAS